MSCWKCTPMCDNCRPKHVYCPNCGQQNYLCLPKCTKCGLVLTDEMKEAAREEWRVRKAAEKAAADAAAQAAAAQ